MLYGLWPYVLQSCHLRFLKNKMPHGLVTLLPLALFEKTNLKNKNKKIKNKKQCLSLLESLMESVTMQDIFFPLLISTIHVFSLELSPTQLLLFLLFTH